MSRVARCLALIIPSLVLAVSLARAETPAPSPLATSGANSRWLSGGLYSALAAQGAFGALPVPLRTRDGGVADLSKGKPPAVLDARVGVNVRLGDDPAVLPAAQRGQAEPHIARSAANPDVLLATFQEGRFAAGGGAIDCGYALSSDGGLTWKRALIPLLTTASGGSSQRATDPVAAIGPQGDLYLNTLGSLDSSFGLGANFVSRSTDNGVTWSAPVVVFQAPNTQVLPDKEWLAVNDFPTAPNSARLVATWTNFTFAANGSSTGNNLLASVSDDRGVSWSTPTAITPAGSLNQGSLPLFLPDGSLVIVYITFANANTSTIFSINCKRSTDGGRTFPAAATAITPLVIGYDDPDLRSGVFLPAAAVARTTGDIFVTYVMLVSGTPRVMVTKSTDKGATWSVPVIASDNPINSAVDNPAIAVTPDGQIVSVVFIDKRLTPTDAAGHNFFIDHFAALSFDGGATWQPNIRLSEMTSDIRYAALTSQGYMLGDYLGVAPSLASTQPCVAIWCDTRTGDADPFTVRFAPLAAANIEAWRIAYNLRLFGDQDNDSVSDNVEFNSGTNPRRAESGEDVLTYRLPDNTLAVAGTERPGLSSTSPAANTLLFLPPLVLFSESTPLSAAELPTVPVRPGLVWAGRKFSIAPNQPAFVVRAQMENAGTPAAPTYLTIETEGVTTSAQTTSRLINLSTRGGVDGSSQMIAGFVIDGPKSILVRAAGPALAGFGLGSLLPDPRVVIGSTDPAGFDVFTNDDWSQGTASPTVFTRLGAFPFATGSLDAAINVSLGRRSYSAVVSDSNNAGGTALVEVYDSDPTPGSPTGARLLNLSTRGNLTTTSGTLIAGFVIGGNQPRRVLVRAVGPSLAQFNVAGALPDPLLTLYRGNFKIAENDDWEISRGSAAAAATAKNVGAFALNPASLDAALLITLPAGAYTAVVTGVNGATGIVLVEVYDAN